ncbi:hypothetical protein NF867_06735 [Solitalea sp. MAHUQ-68]|uniref:Uncharacterized protein n=1 Tax=Solitalea agri TaxID=2953739 RepID=A0A9X2F1U2_9SPHI|nr:hypothetical protein [Solitalea agri]MCO4292550.1 hypothetical protein [Solitalea agri]
MKTTILLAKKLGVSILLFILPLLAIILSLEIVKQFSDNSEQTEQSTSTEVFVDK